MNGISTAIIYSSLVFMTVFIPVLFMSGTSGTFYPQFGLTMAIAVLVLLMKTTKTSLVPDEDQGVLFVNVTTAAGNSLATTNIVMTDIKNRIKDLPQIKGYNKVSGYGLISGQGNSFGMFKP